MGMCMSTNSAASQVPAPPKATALVLLLMGELREYPCPATAAHMLEDVVTDSKGWFRCDSDGMGFEGPVVAVGSIKELPAGWIYFVLPVDALRRRCSLRLEEDAALAVKAFAALTGKTSTVASGSRRGAVVAPLVFSPTKEEEEEEETVRAAHKAAGTKRRPAARPRRQQRQFAPDLTAIPECEMSERVGRRG